MRRDRGWFTLIIGTTVFLTTLATALPVRAVEIGGVVLPETLKAGEEKLLLNGAGLRRKFFVKIYAAGLYLPQKSRNAAAVVNADEPMAIRMHFIYDGISPEQLVETWNEGFKAATGDKTGPIQAEIERFNGFFTETVHKDDVYEIIYTPDKGVRLYIQDRLMGVIPGIAFKRALFGIWLGDEPADGGLKSGMMKN